MKKKKIHKVIGRRDIIDLPELEIFDIPCKIDTGAYTSAIHCREIQLYTDQEGAQALSFRLLDPSHNAYNDLTFSTKKFRRAAIKSSFGEVIYRYIIVTRIQIFGESYKTEFSLADRKSMRYPLLLGRKLLKNNFLVDVDKSNLSFKNKRRSS
ncbi:MAG: ATP-dependent zinc protease [Thermonemataceae bacterium]